MKRKGKTPASKDVLIESPRLTTDLVKADFTPGTELQKLEIGMNAFPDLPPGLAIPISPTWVQITPAEAAGQ
jgi:ribose transport system substrate-binding protein